MLDRTAADAWQESDHPRAANGQFGSGGTVHIVTTAGPGDTEVRDVTDDEDEAADLRDSIADDEEDDSAEHHEVEFERSGAGPVEAVHVVHGPDGSGGTSIYGAYDDAGNASGLAEEHSSAAWEAYGPDRSDFDRDQAEEDEAAEAWNAEHEGEDGALLAKLDDNGFIERDANGDLQWTQDGQDVEPDDDHYAEFGEHFDGMFAPDERPRYPGLAAANEHFESTDQGENVFRVHRHDVKPGVFAKDGAMRKPKDLIALDRASVRRVDADGHLHVERTPISKANVCGYLGREIPGWDKLGLKGDRIYKMWRHPDELQKAVPSAAGKPLFMGHRPVGAADHDHENNVGGVTDPKWEPPYVTAALDVWPQTAIDAIESKEHAEISSAYRYRPDMASGTTPDGERYDGVMRDIDFSHVALVPEGRAGKDVRVHDAALPKLKDIYMTKTVTPSSVAVKADSALIGATLASIGAMMRPKLAQDAKIDLMPALKGVTAKTAKAKAPAIARAVVKAAKGKLAADADLEPAEVQAVVEEVADLIKSESDDIAAAVADPDPAAAPGAAGGEDAPDMDALLSYLDGVLTDEQLAKVKSMLGKGDDDGAEDRKRRGLQAAPSAQDGNKGKPMVTQAAMDEALAKTQREAAAEGAKQAREHAAAVRDAERFVRPYVGDVIATDSAEDVYRAALDVLKVDHKDRPAGVLRDLVEIHGQAKQARDEPRRRDPIAQDAAAEKGFAERVPGADRIRIL